MRSLARPQAAQAIAGLLRGFVSPDYVTMSNEGIKP
jgi:hypothetical protein